MSPNCHLPDQPETVVKSGMAIWSDGKSCLNVKSGGKKYNNEGHGHKKMSAGTTRPGHILHTLTGRQGQIYSVRWKKKNIFSPCPSCSFKKQKKKLADFVSLFNFCKGVLSNFYPEA